MDTTCFILGSAYVIQKPTRMMIELYNFVNNKTQVPTLKRNPGVKIKIFKPNVRYKQSLRQRFENLYCNGYTHVVNMKGGNLLKIKKLAKYYKLTLLDEEYIPKNY